MAQVLAQHDGTPAGGWRCLAAALVGQAAMDIATGNAGHRMTAWAFLRGPLGGVCCDVAGLSRDLWIERLREASAARARAAARERAGARAWP